MTLINFRSARGRKALASTALLATASMIPLAAVAQEATQAPAPAADTSNEIVVTSQKKEQSLQRVPVAVQVVSGASLLKSGTPDLERLSSNMPSVAVRRSANSQRIAIRGIVSGTNRGFEQSVGTFLDGVYYGQGQQIRPKLMDVSRVEVLKGPQSTLFGANVTGGAFNIVTNDPATTLSGYANATIGSRGEQEFNGAVSLPVSDTFGVRVSGYKRQYDGDVKNVDMGRNSPNEDNWGGRIVALYKPSSDLTVRAAYEHQELRGIGNSIELTYDPSVAARNEAIVGLPGKLDYVQSGGILEGYSALPDGPIRDKLNLDTASLKVAYDAGPVNITSVTGYTEFTWDNLTDYDYSSAQNLAAEVYQHFRQYSQELRADGSFGKLDAVAGAYFHRQILDNLVINESIPLDNVSTSPAHQTSNYWAVFGQGVYHLTDTLRVTGGLRFDGLDKEAHDVLTYSNPAATRIFSANAHDVRGKLHENHVSWLGRFEADLTPDIMAYATVTRGFKSGGFDINGAGSSSGSTASANFMFAPERVTNYEGGAKLRLFNRSATLNISVYNTDLKNLQVTQFTGTSYVVGNAGARARGFDIDYRQTITPSLSVAATVAYNDLKYTSYQGASCNSRQLAGLQAGCDMTTRTQDLTGKVGEYAPKVTGAANIDYRHAVNDTFDAVINLNPNFTTKYYTQSGLDPNTLQKGFVLLNARVGISAPDDRWAVQLIGRNLTDKIAFVNSFNASTPSLTYAKVPNQRRSFAVQFDVRF